MIINTLAFTFVISFKRQCLQKRILGANAKSSTFFNNIQINFLNLCFELKFRIAVKI